VHLEFPEDIAAEQIEAQPVPESNARRPTAEEKSFVAAVRMIEAARSPLIVIGAGANRKLTSRMLRRFVDATGIPFCSTQMGKGVIDERHDLFVGCASLSSNDFLHRAIGRADLIINVGHDVVEKPPFLMDAPGQQVIHVNFISASVDPVYYPQCEVVGDIANSVWELGERVTPQPHWEFTEFRRIKARVDANLTEGADDSRFPIYPQRLVRDVRAAMPDDGIIALDNGVYKIWFARNYRATAPNTVLLDNALATMGAGLPSAIAAKIVHPNRRVMAICGDGGFMMNSQELETAVRLHLDLVVLILRDDAYGMIKWKQANMGFADFGLDFGNPDFVRYADSYGAHGHRVGAASELVTLLSDCLATPGVHVVDCPVDYSDNDRILNRDLRRASAEL
jgi:acetolactate synthase-1/2/3 large subunit